MGLNPDEGRLTPFTRFLYSVTLFYAYIFLIELCYFAVRI